MNGHDVSIIKNDHRAHDPSGTGLVGRASGVNLNETAFAHPVIFYGGRHSPARFIRADLFKMDGAPDYLVLYCPVCQNALRITEDNKRIEYDPEVKPRFGSVREEDILVGLSTPDLGGLLSVERFRCAWEVQPDLRRSFGFAICPWQVVIDNNVARDV